MKRLLAFVFIGTVAALASADIFYTTDGFDSYNYGPVNGQGISANVPAGWQDISSPANNMAVISDGPQALFGKALRFQVPNTQNDTSAAQIVFAQDLRAIASNVTVRFSVYRQRDSWNSNFWFSANGNNPEFGLQWDGGNGVSQTLPLGFGNGGEPTAMNNWVDVVLHFDFTGQFPTATGTYNGDPVANATYNDPNAPFSTWTGWKFSLQHDEASSDTEVLWVDSFRIEYTPIPEPAGLALLAVGLLLRRR